ncbi:MAG: histidine phosphatase family protein [Actinomycetota bacterium]
MDLVLIRHARPERIEGAAGPADPDLTDLGHRQAKAMADWVAAETFDAVYSSPMARARQTAAPLEAALGMTATIVDGIQEFDASENHYIPMEDMKADKEAWRQFLQVEMQRDMSEFSATVVEALEGIIADHRGDRVAVVCHGGVVNVWAAHVLGLSPMMFFAPDYTSVSRFAAASSGQRSIVSLNELSHLRGID